MVIETAALARPRRMAAVKGVKEASARLMSSRSDQPKTGSLAKRQKRPSLPAAVVANDDDAGDSSDLTEESDEEAEDVSSVMSSDSDSKEDSESEQDTYAPTKKKTMAKRRVASTSSARAPAARSTSKAKPAQKSAKAAPAKTPRKKAAQKAKSTRTPTSAAVGGGRARRGGNKDEIAINADNVLFNAVTTADADLRDTAEQWMVYYQDNKPAALAQFVNFVFRACGSNSSIDETQVEDIDHVVDVLEEVQAEFKKANPPSYPLVSRSATYRKFRRSLSELMEHIFTAAIEADVLGDESMVDTLIAWIGAMSSSTFRAFRHTATTYILMMMGQIARLNQDARKQFEQSSRLRDAEKSKSSTSARTKQLSEQVRRINAQRQMLDRFHKELDEAVFIHRYRDSDPTIRADCMEELGRWMRICPAQFLNNNHLRYFAWELSDASAVVRLVVVQALKSLYARQATAAHSQALEVFAQRSLERMVEIATGDVDNGVRIAMIATLASADQAGVLDDDEARDTIACHIFDVDVKVRHAIARFMANMVNSNVEEADADKESATEKLRLKALGKILARLNAQVGDGEEHARKGGVELHSLDGTSGQSRISLALRAIVDATDLLQDWNPLLDLLVIDHTGSQERAKKPAVRLEAAEEAVLVECLTVLLQKANEPAIREKGLAIVEEDDSALAMTKDLIPVLSKLLNKYKTEASRITNILVLVKHMKLAAYLDYQQTAAYETLWDQVVDQFQRHSEAEVIECAVGAMSSLVATSALSQVNEDKLQAVLETSMTALKDAVPSFAQLTGSRGLILDVVHNLQACTTRIKFLIRAFDLSAAFDDSEDDQSGGAWDILLACAQRASLERQDEAFMIEQAIVSLGLYIMWKIVGLTKLEDKQAQAAQAEILLNKRQPFLSLCERALESTSDEAGMLGVRKQAFRCLLEIHIVYANLAVLHEQQAAAHANIDDEALPEGLQLTMSNSMQDTLATYAQDAVRRFGGEVRRNGSATQTTLNEDEEEGATDYTVSLGFLRKQHDFASIISPYIAAIRIGLVDVQRAAPLLAYYGRVGALYDACLRTLVEAVREEGIYQLRPTAACKVLLQTLVQAFALVQADPETELTFVNLSKMLSGAVVVRGAHLSITQSMDASAVIQLHERMIEWTITQVQKIDGPGTLALSMFKAMSQLLVGIQPREALLIKSSLDRILTAHNVEVPATAKVWDSLHSYEKRLVTIASKSAAFARARAAQAQGQQGKRASQTARRPAHDASDADSQQEDGASDAPGSSPADSPTVSRPRPRARPRTTRSTQDSFISARPILTQQQDDDEVDSILGRARRALDSDEEDDDGDLIGMGNASQLSMPAFDLSGQTSTSAAEASQLLFRGNASQSQSQSVAKASQASSRPSRRSRPSQSFAESESEDEAAHTSRRKRSRRA